MIKKEEFLKLIKKHCDEDCFYKLMGESRDVFWNRYDDSMNFTSSQMKKMVVLLKIKNPVYFFYG